MAILSDARAAARSSLAEATAAHRQAAQAASHAQEQAVAAQTVVAQAETAVQRHRAIDNECAAEQAAQVRRAIEAGAAMPARLEGASDFVDAGRARDEAIAWQRAVSIAATELASKAQAAAAYAEQTLAQVRYRAEGVMQADLAVLAEKTIDAEMQATQLRAHLTAASRVWIQRRTGMGPINLPPAVLRLLNTKPANAVDPSELGTAMREAVATSSPWWDGYAARLIKDENAPSVAAAITGDQLEGKTCRNAHTPASTPSASKATQSSPNPVVARLPTSPLRAAE